MKGTRKYLLTLVSILALFTAEARHIIGGEVTYVCNGNGTYTFTMFVYRDCSTDGAAFDNPATITIYRGNTGPYTLVENLSVNISGDITNIPPPEDPCLLLPPNVCVQEAKYVFTVGLPVSDESYHVVYQRCCRNNTINNIIDPQDAGATYTVELTPRAQELCNDSPVYDEFPPTVICVNEELVFDHGATDSDGDQLVYEFCNPLLGGGVLGTNENPGDPSSCNGVIPNPGCPPPFGLVPFALPTYSAQNPMGGAPQIQIDPNTGVITGTPDIQGQYVVGVCVKEYRNGELLSIVRRDFQFNVASCEPVVLANIESDDVINGQDFVINSCGESTVTFNNLSVQQQFIDDFRWEFDINGTMETFTDWNATVNFPGVGTYEGKLFLNPEYDCGDTANIFVNVYPDLDADFSFVYDTCVAGPVDFTDLSTAEAGPDAIVEWEWDFAGVGSSDEQNPSYQFMAPGDLPVSLTITDINGCQDTETQIVPWYPAPAIIIVEPSSFLGCVPMEVFFNNLSFPIDSTYDIVWDFGDGTTSSDISPTHIYEEPGTYNISLEVTSPIGCFASESWNNWITARPSPIADFVYSPQDISSFAPEVTFTDQSIEAITWYWDFDGESISLEQNPVYEFRDTGLQEVTLIVTHQSGCQDSLTQLLDIVPRVSYFLPNAFTPNSDDINDFFRGKGIFEGMSNFELTIWNRWGELVFKTGDPYEGWNGQKNNNGKPSPNGVYVCIVNYTGPRGGDFQLKGFATLIR